MKKEFLILFTIMFILTSCEVLEKMKEKSSENSDGVTKACVITLVNADGNEDGACIKGKDLSNFVCNEVADKLQDVIESNSGDITDYDFAFDSVENCPTTLVLEKDGSDSTQDSFGRCDVVVEDLTLELRLYGVNNFKTEETQRLGCETSTTASPSGLGGTWTAN